MSRPINPNAGRHWAGYLPADVADLLQSMTKAERGSAVRYLTRLVRDDQAKKQEAKK